MHKRGEKADREKAADRAHCGGLIRNIHPTVGEDGSSSMGRMKWGETMPILEQRKEAQLDVKIKANGAKTH